MSKQLIATLAVFVVGTAEATFVTDTDWSRFEGPSHPNLTSRREFAINPGRPISAVWYVQAEGDVPASTLAGFASIDADRVGQATRGFYFDSAQSFSFGIEFIDSFLSFDGAGVAGLRIGRSIDGADSAGIEVGLGGVDAAQPISAVGSVGGAAVASRPFVEVSDGQGSLSVSYDAATGDVTAGWSLGGPSLLEAQVLPGIGSQWTAGPLFVWFYVRSEGIVDLAPGTGRPLEAIFLRQEVLNGTPVRVPEPEAVALAVAAVVGNRMRRRV